MATSFLTSLTDFIASYPHFAYAAVLLLALSESLPVIGAVVPGTALIIAISALVPMGAVKLWPLLAAATAGAIIGDGLSFWIGHRYQREILNVWPLNRYPELIVRSESFFARYGDKSVFLARFTPGVRAFVPLLAGVLRMTPPRFYAANILSAVAWAPAHILPGVAVGASLGMLGGAAKSFAVLLVLLVVTLWALKHAVRFALHRGVPQLTAAAERLRGWAHTYDIWWSRLLLDLLDPSRPDAKWLAVLIVLLVGTAWLFLAILEDVVSGDPLVRADMTVYRALQNLRTPPSDAVMIAITELGDTVVVVAVTAAVGLWLAWKRAWHAAIYWLVAIAGASALNTVIKVTLHRARPEELFYTGWSAFSFPSGHSTVNLVLYGFLAFLIACELRPAWRLPLAFGAASFALLIAFSRMYLGAHWFSDTVGGLAFGTAWLIAVGLFYLRKPSESVAPVGLIAAAGAALALAGGLNVYGHHAQDVGRYAVQNTPPVSIAGDNWWNSGWQQLPARRIDLSGEAEEPLTIQWAGSLSMLQEQLLRNGWRVPAAWTPTSTLSWFSAKSDPAELPVIPLFAGGRLPSLTLVQLNGAGPGASRLVLRLWEADLELTNGQSSPVWIGSVVDQRIERTFSLFTWVSVKLDMNTPRNRLADAVNTGRVVTRTDTAADRYWDAGVLLIRESGRRTSR